jgi:hypothetical protein
MTGREGGREGGGRGERRGGGEGGRERGREAETETEGGNTRKGHECLRHIMRLHRLGHRELGRQRLRDTGCGV